ncbi:MAG TPA: (Fe-S)-binding protein [Chthoniobacteraceae bacterium]|nr:(Fe-S)-binding protein [Chthoniobacteraceae bacterium]
MRVTLFVPCFMNTMFPRAGMSIVTVLERLGHTVDYHEDIFCCGQPAFNAGYWDEARTVAGPVVKKLAAADPEAIVIGSGSCGAMLKVFYRELFANTALAADAVTIGERTWEFSDFLVTKLGITDVGARFPAKVTFHDGCHGLRELRVKQQPRKLLAQVQGLELVEMRDSETCCGFGGTFSAKFPAISTAMGEVKCASAAETEAEYIVSNDSSCLMQIQGLLDRQGKKLKTMHLAEVLVRQ